MTREEKIDKLKDAVQFKYAYFSVVTERLEIYDEIGKQLLDFIDELTQPNCKPCPRYEPQPYTHLTLTTGE